MMFGGIFSFFCTPQRPIVFVFINTGPLASVISTKKSCRFATMLGGLSAAIGLALSYFATSVEFLYFSYGILGGSQS